MQSSTMFVTPDLNTLLSSFFQAGATLVAIVAGIIGARFVAAHGEVQVLRDRIRLLADAEAKLSAKA